MKRGRTKAPGCVRDYFAGDAPYRPGKAQALCVATDAENPEWHHADRNPANKDFTNWIPLVRRLNSKIGGSNRPLSVERKSVRESIDVQLAPEALLNRGRELLLLWRPTDAYAAANLADWMTYLRYGNLNPTLRLDCILDALRYARQAFNPEILQQLYGGRLDRLLTHELAESDQIRVLTDLTTTYSYIGQAATSHELAVIIEEICKRASPPSRPGIYDKRARRCAQSIGVRSPKDGLRRLDAIADSAVALDARADVANSRSNISLVHGDMKGIKRAHEVLQSNMKTYCFVGRSRDISPRDVLISNAIGEHWHSILTAIILHDWTAADTAIDKLRALMHIDETQRRKTPPYLPPPPWPSLYVDILKANRSRFAEKAFSLYELVGQPSAPSNLLQTLDRCRRKIFTLLRRDKR